jgi:hypothetical protein
LITLIVIPFSSKQDWIEECLSKNELVDHADFVLNASKKSKPSTTTTAPASSSSSSSSSSAPAPVLSKTDQEGETTSLKIDFARLPDVFPSSFFTFFHCPRFLSTNHHHDHDHPAFCDEIFAIMEWEDVRVFVLGDLKTQSQEIIRYIIALGGSAILHYSLLDSTVTHIITDNSFKVSPHSSFLQLSFSLSDSFSFSIEPKGDRGSQVCVQEQERPIREIELGLGLCQPSGPRKRVW